MQTVPSFAVPEIVVAGEDGVISAQSPSSDPPTPSISHGLPSAWHSHVASSIDTGVAYSGQLRHRAESRPPSPSSPTTPGLRPSMDLRREGSGSSYSSHSSHSRSRSHSHSASPGDDLQQSYGANTMSTGSDEPGRRQNVLEVLDNSAWGESMRRSFTLRRPS